MKDVPARPLAGHRREEIEETNEPSTQTKVEYYGWQILLTDVASEAAGVAIGDMTTFAGGYLLGGPLVHLGHGNTGRALGSAALRAGLPVLGYSLVLLTEEECSEEDCDDIGRVCRRRRCRCARDGRRGRPRLDPAGLVERGGAGEARSDLVPQVSAGADGSLQLGVLGRF